MEYYRSKCIDYGYKKKLLNYHYPIYKGINYSSKKRKKYNSMNNLEKTISDKRRFKYYQNKVKEIYEIALMNTDLNMFVTLTFREAIVSYKEAKEKWQLFIKRLRNYYDFPLKYISVWEYQKARSIKEGFTDGGIYHFHCLLNIGFIEQKQLEQIWQYGFVWINWLGKDSSRIYTINYMLKYITKDVLVNISEHNKRFIFTSNNLIKPQISISKDPINIYETIFMYSDDIIDDGTYDIKDIYNTTINGVDYINLRKGDLT